MLERSEALAELAHRYFRSHGPAQLQDFAEGELESEEPGAFPVPLLTLTGIGGAGKWTVLGAFVKPYLARIEEGDLLQGVIDLGIGEEEEAFEYLRQRAARTSAVATAKCR